MDLSAWEPHQAAMWAYHRGDHDAVIVVYDDFERDEIPVSYFFRSPEQFPSLESRALDLCRGRVLDVGAGSGCLMNGLGLAETLAGLRGLFQHARRLVGPGGQILADSTDVRVRMDREAARSGTLERPDGRYVGELHFQLEFEGRKGPPFGQLYVDPKTLARCALEAGWRCDILLSPDQYGNFLARLTA